MGSSNRDYMQDDYQTRQPWGYDTPTTKWLLIITVIVFFLQTLLVHDVDIGKPEPSNVAANPREHGRLNIQQVSFRGQGLPSSYVEDWFLLEPGKVLHGQVWRLVTFVFCNDRGAPFFLIFQMFFLWFLGTGLERIYGSRELLYFYLAAALFCGLIFVAFGLSMDLYPLMGSGASIMAMFALYATHYPRQEILFCWVLPIQIRVLLVIYIGLDVYGIVLASSGQSSWATVAAMSGLWGIVFGYVYRQKNLRLAEFVEKFDLRSIQKSLRRASTKRTLKVYEPEPQSNLDEQVDAILEKIHLHGSESLTDRERAILQKASERAKNRL